MTDGHLGLVLSAVSHDYGGQPVLRDLTLAVQPGELVCVLGPSGCGKTTTLRLAAGLESPKQGVVMLKGQVVSGQGRHIPPEGRHVGFLFQDFALFPHLSVLDNVGFGLAGLPAAQRRSRSMQMLDQVGMAAYADAWPHQLSGGQQQRVALARALAPQPELMLLDEPFSGLDKRLRDQIRDETLHVLKSNRVSTLMVTHDPEEAMFMADRIAIMRDGALVQMGSPAELYDAPHDGFVASFFGEVNDLPATVIGGVARSVVGTFAAPGLTDGAAAQVLIRPEAVSLHPDPTGTATVLAARPLGRCSLIHLRVQPVSGPVGHVHARIAPGPLPAEGTTVRLAVDDRQVFVFPA